jgi:phosphate transport system substrate-binding protein
MKKIIFLLALVVFSTPAFAGKIEIKGSTTVLPVAQKTIEAYMALNPKTVITLSGGGTGNGFKALIDGTTTICNASRFIKDKEAKQAIEKNIIPVAHRVALDCIVPIVHKDNPVKNLSKAQLKDIYTGKITNWKDLGGKDMKIVAITRDSSSGTFDAWKEMVMDEERVTPAALTQPSNGGLVTQIGSTKGAIGYIALGYVTKKVKILSVDGVKGSDQTAKNGQYKISRPLFMFTNGWPEGETLDYINFVLSPKGQALVKAAGSITLN